MRTIRKFIFLLPLPFKYIQTKNISNLYPSTIHKTPRVKKTNKNKIDLPIIITICILILLLIKVWPYVGGRQVSVCARRQRYEGRRSRYCFKLGLHGAPRPRPTAEKAYGSGMVEY